MDLTGSTLLDSVIALTVVSVVLTVWLWPRLAKRGILWILARLGMILMSQLSLVLVAALMINNYGDFYPTWDDLVGGGNTQITFSTDNTGGNTAVSTGDSSLVVPDPGQVQGWKPSGPSNVVGQLTSVRVLGKESRLSALAYVYLPPQYFQAAYAHKAFPIITDFTGFPGAIGGLAERLKTPEQVATLERQGKMQPTVLVMISQNVASPRDTDCVNVVKGPQVDTFLSSDYQLAIHSAYRITTDPAGWALTGVSEGGTCSLQLAMEHPTMFGVVGDLGGDYAQLEDGQSGNLFGPLHSESRTRLMEQYNLYWRLKNLPAPDIQVLIATTAKEYDYKATEEFLTDVKDPLSVTTMLLKTGGHNFTTWGLEQDPSLIWMSSRLGGPVALPDTAGQKPTAQ
jgi:enterochelin esterase-like enzyme